MKRLLLIAVLAVSVEAQVTLTQSSATSRYGERVTFTATYPAGATGVSILYYRAFGTVWDDRVAEAPIVNGVATFNFIVPFAGTHTYSLHSGPAVNHTVLPGEATLTTSDDGEFLTATVTPRYYVGLQPIMGTITVSENGNVIGSGPIGTPIPLGAFGSGTHALTVGYSGEARYSPITATHAIPGHTDADASNAFANEGDSGLVEAAVTVTLDGPSRGNISIDWQTDDGTAIAGEDYEPASGRISFARGEKSKSIVVLLRGDTTREPDETFFVTLHGATNASLRNPTATVTIRADDPYFTTHDGIRYSERLGWPLQATLRVPLDTPKPPPLVIAVGGTSWNTITRRDTAAIWLATRGYAVATIDVTPASIASAPAQSDDVREAMIWLRANAHSYGFDPSRIALFGADAGGYVVTIAGTTSEVAGVVAWSPPIDLLDTTSCGSLAAEIESLLGCAAEACPETAAAASALREISPGDPPFLVVHAGNNCDTPIAHSRKLDEALRNAGIASRLFELDTWWEAAAREETEKFLARLWQRPKRRAVR